MWQSLHRFSFFLLFLLLLLLLLFFRLFLLILLLFPLLLFLLLLLTLLNLRFLLFLFLLVPLLLFFLPLHLPHLVPPPLPSSPLSSYSPLLLLAPSLPLLPSPPSSYSSSSFVLLFLFILLSPWYNRNGWLGVKHQVAYYSFFFSLFLILLLALLLLLSFLRLLLPFRLLPWDTFLTIDNGDVPTVISSNTSVMQGSCSDHPIHVIRFRGRSVMTTRGHSPRNDCLWGREPSSSASISPVADCATCLYNIAVVECLNCLGVYTLKPKGEAMIRSMDSIIYAHFTFSQLDKDFRKLRMMCQRHWQCGWSLFFDIFELLVCILGKEPADCKLILEIVYSCSMLN